MRGFIVTSSPSESKAALRDAEDLFKSLIDLDVDETSIGRDFHSRLINDIEKLRSGNANRSEFVSICKGVSFLRTFKASDGSDRTNSSMVAEIFRRPRKVVR